MEDLAYRTNGVLNEEFKSGFLVKNKSHVPNRRSGPATCVTTDWYTRRAANSAVIRNISTIISLFFLVLSLKESGYNANQVNRKLTDEVLSFSAHVNFDLLKIFIHMNAIKLSTIRTYFSHLRIFLRYLYRSKTISAKVKFPTIDLNTKSDMLQIFLYFCFFCHLEVISLRTTIWKYLFCKSFSSTEKSNLSRNSIVTYCSGLIYFGKMFFFSVESDFPDIEGKFIRKLNATLLSANKATKPFDSYVTLQKFCQWGFKSSILQDKNFFFHLWMGFLFCLRPGAAFNLTLDDFTFFNGEGHLVDEVPYRISSVFLTVSSYKNRKFIDDTKVISMTSIPKLGILNPTRMILEFVHLDWSKLKKYSRYDYFHLKLNEFWKSHPELKRKNRNKKLSLGSPRMTMICLLEEMNLTIDEMRKITFHRSDCLQNVYLQKKKNTAQRKFVKKLKGLF